MSLHPGQASSAEWLAAAAARDPGVLAPALGTAADNIDQSGLDVRTHALVRLAALVAAGESGTAYDQPVATALDQGVTLDEIVGVLVALLPTMGAARVTVAAPALRGAISRVAGDIQADGWATRA